MSRTWSPKRWALFGTLAGSVLCVERTPAQEAVIVNGQPMVVPAGASPGRPPNGGPPMPGQPMPGTPADGGKKEGDKKEGDGTIKIIRRPEKPTEPGDPKQFEVSPNADGKIPFNFEGAPWPQVMEWLARVSHLSLDWQELPGDYLNLRTQREYTVPEAQNLINRHLLSRGFTILIEGEMLTVANISKINAALVPRIEPADLVNHRDYEFAKTSFELEWMLAEQAVTELQPMMSPNGKLTALKGTNRVEAMDAVTNLRDVHDMLLKSQSEDASQTIMVRTFKLEHRRAGDVVVYLYDILGLDKRMLASAGGGGGGGGRMSDGMSMQIMNQLQQMQQMMQQQANRGNGQPGGGGVPAEPRIVVNDRENTILASAPFDKMEIIEQTIKAVDVPGEEAARMLANVSRVKVYRLATMEPGPIVQILSELGEMSPQSRLQTDDTNKSLIVYGTLADHYTVQSLVERLDGSTRAFEVIQLRRVRADAVAGTIKYMFGVEDEKKDNNSRRSYYSFYDYYGGGSSNQDKKEQRPFKVDADIDRNRLLVWANESEMEEVRGLLVKMGEMPPGVSNPETLRAFEVESDEEADKLLEKLRELWPELNPNNLEIRARKNAHETAPVPAADSVTPPGKTAAAGPKHSMHSITAPIRLALTSANDAVEQNASGEVEQSADQPTVETELAPEDLEREFFERQRRQSTDHPPVTIQRAPNGRILFSSPDTSALDRMEDLLHDIAPPVKDYKIFHLKYPDTWAYGIELNLKDFFKPEGEETEFRDWFGDPVRVNEQGPASMSSRKPLKIISDADSRTILVQGATPEQLQIIQDLIDVYDQPVSSDPHAIRRMQTFQVNYSKASVIADTLKQVYRDLLSANDPALNNNNQGKDQKPAESGGITYVYGNRGNSGDDEGADKAQDQPIKFKGLLSVGVDEVSNTIVVSALEGMLEDIGELIKRLDEAAKPDVKVEIVEVKNIDPNVLKAKLESAFGGAAAVRTSESGNRNGRNNNGNDPNNPNNNNGNSQGQPNGNPQPGGAFVPGG